MQNVAIVGVGQTRFEGKKEGQSLMEVVYEAASAALEDAGVKREEVESVVIAAADQVDGRAISSMVTACPAGGYLKDEVKVTNEGSYAAILASLRIISGVFDLSLAVSWSKCSEAPLAYVTHLSTDPFFHRGLGLNHVTASALQAGLYKEHYQVPEEAVAQTVVRSRSQALKNPCAHLREEVGMEEVLRSPFVAWPLRWLELPPESDGAVALVLASAERAKKLGRKPAWIIGMGWASETYYLGERNLLELTSLKAAAGQAYRMAAIARPEEELDVIETDAPSAYHELMIAEALGLCEEGCGKDLALGRKTHPEVNPSGGTLSTNPFFASGLVRVAEAALQVMGRAGERQVEGARTALAHGSSGFCAQENSVLVLRGSL